MRRRIRAGGGGGGDIVITPPAPNDTDQTADIGTLGQELSSIGGALDPQPIGAQDHFLPSDVLDLEGDFPVGFIDNLLRPANADGEADDDLGAVDNALTRIDGALDPQTVGETDNVISAYVLTTVVDYVSSATATGDWTNPANAQGIEDAALASIDATAGVGVDNASGVLTCSFNAGAVNPGDFGARGDVALRVIHRIDTTMALNSNATAILRMEKANGTDAFTLVTSIRAATSPVGNSNVRNDAAIFTETFDITANVSGWTEAELAQAVVEMDFTASAIVAGGNAVWEVDAAAIARDYTRNGIT